MQDSSGIMEGEASRVQLPQLLPRAASGYQVPGAPVFASPWIKSSPRVLSSTY